MDSEVIKGYGAGRAIVRGAKDAVSYEIKRAKTPKHLRPQKYIPGKLQETAWSRSQQAVTKSAFGVEHTFSKERKRNTRGQNTASGAVLGGLVGAHVGTIPAEYASDAHESKKYWGKNEHLNRDKQKKSAWAGRQSFEQGRSLLRDNPEHLDGDRGVAHNRRNGRISIQNAETHWANSKTYGDAADDYGKQAAKWGRSRNKRLAVAGGVLAGGIAGGAAIGHAMPHKKKPVSKMVVPKGVKPGSLQRVPRLDKAKKAKSEAILAGHKLVELAHQPTPLRTPNGVPRYG